MFIVVATYTSQKLFSSRQILIDLLVYGPLTDVYHRQKSPMLAIAIFKTSKVCDRSPARFLLDGKLMQHAGLW